MLPELPTPVEPTLFKSLGCWRDTGNRAVPTLEGKAARLKGSGSTRDFAIDLCYQAAKARGFHIFALQSGACYGMSRSERYQKYGNNTKNCKYGKGGSWANDVYQIGGNYLFSVLLISCRFSIHCSIPTSSKA